MFFIDDESGESNLEQFENKFGLAFCFCLKNLVGKSSIKLAQVVS